ncbi:MULTISPECIES: hypothetical protein [Sorangium]|uniref:Secreted protein n=1 Tax=Sorangium cellulosum (strain So ce56) TaxID=448385 RepID=A9EWC6_SORC5|nr:hypothetical protein [Sorangium cellulosum]CAN94307.1 hypothetical protein predicted by Glimmer/Critica [Sorangium cellulosum So ce56]
MVELLNTRLMCVAMAMAALATGCAVGAGEADVDESDADEAVTVEEASQALCGDASWARSCGAPGGFTDPSWGWPNGNLGFPNGNLGFPTCGNGSFFGGNPWGNPGWNNWGNFGNFRPCGWNSPWGGFRPPCGRPGWGGGGCGRF